PHPRRAERRERAARSGRAAAGGLGRRDAGASRARLVPRDADPRRRATVPPRIPALLPDPLGAERDRGIRLPVPPAPSGRRRGRGDVAAPAALPARMSLLCYLSE